MGLLDQVMADDMALGFLDTDTFAETGIYTPYGGTPRTIKVVVDRDPLILDPNIPRPKMRITVANSATTGIAATTLNTGGDKFNIAYIVGGTAEDFSITNSSVGNVDAAALELELR